MKRKLLAFICGSLTIITHGQSLWQPQVSGTTQDLEGITFVPGTTKGWIVGTGGTILHTEDGINWTPQTSNVTATFYDVSFQSTMVATFGWACGSAGTIVATDDGGASWYTQTQGAPYTMFSIDFRDISNGLVAGDQFFANSTNGGNAWSPSMSGNTFQAVDFVNSNSGWMCGNNGYITKTTDGGANWTVQSSGTTQHLHGIDFINENEGWACGYTGTMLHTTDGGATWTTQTTNNGNLLSSVQFLDDQNGWACGYTGTILRTTDGGNSWISYTTGTYEWLTDLYFESSTKGWVVGENGTILHFDNSSTATLSESITTSMRIYPNPASDFISIETSANANEVSIFDLQGNLILKSNEKVIDIQSLVKGLYIITVATEAELLHQQFIKE